MTNKSKERIISWAIIIVIAISSSSLGMSISKKMSESRELNDELYNLIINKITECNEYKLSVDDFCEFQYQSDFDEICPDQALFIDIHSTNTLTK